MVAIVKMRACIVHIVCVLCLLSCFHVHSVRIPFLPRRPPETWDTKSSLGPSIAPAPSPQHRGPIGAPHLNPFSRHHRHRHHMVPNVSSIPASAPASGCGQTCLEPLTVTPMGSPCGCVFPIKVQLILSIAVYGLFPEVNELEIEVAAGTYLKHSQVQIVGAGADDQNQGNTKVDINLVPLGEKFDNMTATLIVEKFLRKEVPLNRTLFGSYYVKSIYYPGTESVLDAEGYLGAPSHGDHQRPITANILDKSSRMNPKIMVIIVISALVLLFACSAAISILITCRKDRKQSDDVGDAFMPSLSKKTGFESTLSSCMASPTSMSLLSSIPTCALSVKTFSLVELENATEKFSSRRVLGEGGFGRVYQGTLEDGMEVAVKLLTKDNQHGDPEFVSEIEMLSRLHHRNLVKLIGFCIEGHRRCLVYELVRNGSVESHLHGADRETKPLDWDARIKIALGAARGLAYLHEDSNPRVIHRDFKASNVLLEDDFTPKVSDFGLAREATEGSHHVSTRVMGTFGYVAPEYAMTGHLLVKSDVYSYGVVLLELLTGRKPVDMSQPPGQENLVTWARPLLTTREGLEQLIDPSLVGTCDIEDMSKVADIASMCVHTEVTQRPFMGEVVQALKLIYNDTDETCADIDTQKDSSAHDLDSRSDVGPYDSSWWNAGGASLSPGLRYDQASPLFITMEYSSDPLEDMMDNRRFTGERVALPIRHGNRSGPLVTMRSKRSFYSLRGSVSEPGAPRSRQLSNHGFFVD